MICPNCGTETSSPFCPNCGTVQVPTSDAVPVVQLPPLGKYLGNGDYLVVNKTCVTLYKSGVLGYKTRQLAYRDIIAISYHAAGGGKEGFLCFRGMDDMSKPPATEETYKQDPASVRFGSQMSPKFHEIYTALEPLARWNASPIGPEPVLREAPAAQQRSAPTPTAQELEYTRLARCPRCRSTSIRADKRGYSFGWGLLGFFLIPVAGLLLGCIGSKGIRCHCLNCGKRWKP